MRAAMIAPSLWVPLLMLSSGCPELDPGSVPADCLDGQVLLRVGGRWQCGSPPALRAPLPIPSCLNEYGMIDVPRALSSDGEVLSCAEADYSIQSALAKAALDVEALGKRAAAYETVPDAPPSLYRGVTSARSTGLITAPGVDSGLPAAAAICAAEYPGSHLCSSLELYDSAAQGKLTRDARIPKAWVYFPSWNALATAQQRYEGLADSCGSYTYEKDDRGWSGIAVEWTLLPTSFVGFKWNGGTSAACSSLLPLACCGGVP